MRDPLIMVAPNGAYKTRDDHPALPVTTAELVQTAVACFKAGAGAIHAHIRDDEGRHTLDATRYKALLDALASAVPDMRVQITTEAAGRYSPAEQRALLDTLSPPWISAAVREILADDDVEAAAAFYSKARKQNTQIQHILYDAADLVRLDRLVTDGVVQDIRPSVLFVLGRYTENKQSGPEDLLPFLQARAESRHLGDCHFMACAFGSREIDCLVAAAKAGGDCRIGFENNLHTPGGEVAKDNASQVETLRHALALAGFF
ncbi:3-keto-5-aminohexanoate cleavage protein [Granulosicoccaceae sp. 1_MG-2023]|nr:3-keto-5-aminohexanoate cleavage protein [Granulosicoccaceae sp. 1_MG-2023]